MAFTEVMNTMRENLQRSLDELTSSRTSLKSKTLALGNLERTLATASFGLDSQEAKDAFIALQHTFECNLPSRLLPWIMATTTRLEALTNSNHKSQEEDGKGTEIEDLSSQLAVSLTLIQGVTLNHEASKTFMGRKPSLEILLDLLLTSRHIATGIGTRDPQSSPTKGAGSSSSPMPPQPPLTSLVLDTLLCILVDSSPALRAFEEASGVQSIVKILKRAGTPREVRMKCLEFLYFYLLDETPDPSSASLLKNLKMSQPTPPPTAPATPVRPSPSPPSSSIFPNSKQKPYMNATPLRPSTMSRYGSSSFSFSTASSSTSTTTSDGNNRLSTSASSLASVSTSSRSTSGSSMYSFSSTSSNASSETAASSIPASPVKECFGVSESPLDKLGSGSTANSNGNSNSNLRAKSPVKRAGISSTSSVNGNEDAPAAKATTTTNSNSENSGNSTSGLKRQGTPILPRSLMMLRKEVEFVPLSPKKSPTTSASSSSSSTAATANPGTPTTGVKSFPRAGSGSGSGLGSRSQTRVGHRKSLSTSTLSGSGSGTGSSFGSPGIVGARTSSRVRMEGSLPCVPVGKNSNHPIPNRSGGDDTDVDIDIEKDAIVIDRYILSSSSSSSFSSTSSGGRDGTGDGDRKWKTTEEKKEFLGTMLGNVDALVEGVRKAGIWGLG